MSLYYRPQRSCGKVMFLHLPVILFTGGGGRSLSRGVSVRETQYSYLRAVRILLECIFVLFEAFMVYSVVFCYWNIIYVLNRLWIELSFIQDTLATSWYVGITGLNLSIEVRGFIFQQPKVSHVFLKYFMFRRKGRPFIENLFQCHFFCDSRATRELSIRRKEF